MVRMSIIEHACQSTQEGPSTPARAPPRMIGRAQRRRDSVEATTKAFDQHRSFVAERLTLTGELTELTDEQAAALWSALIANAVEVLTDLGFVFQPYPGLADLTADDSELSADGFAVDEMARYAAQARKLTMDLRWALDQVEKQHSTADARKDP